MAKTFIDLPEEIDDMVCIKKKIDHLNTKGDVIISILEEYFIQEQKIKELIKNNENFKLEIK